MRGMVAVFAQANRSHTDISNICRSDSKLSGETEVEVVAVPLVETGCADSLLMAARLLEARRKLIQKTSR